jgi:mannitol-1-phosphate 5-dehydrogenase
MKAVIIGAGRVGLGCAAEQAHLAGLDVVVLGRGSIVADLDRHRVVRVLATDGPTTAERDIPLRAVDLVADPAAAAAEIAAADLVCTAVGAQALPDILDLLARGLELADHPVDVIAFENREDAGALLRTGVAARAATPIEHGFSGAVVDRVVAHRRPADGATPVTVVAEPHCRIVVDGTALHGDWRILPALQATDNFRAWFRRKLHVYSAGHASAAYLGQLKGYRYVHAAVADPEIAAAVLGAMAEGRRGLLAQYGPAVAGTPAEVTAILARFGNAALGDTTQRVGRDVPRKVARRDRLIGPARAAQQAGWAPVHLSFVVAAALHAHLRPDQREDLPGTVAQLTGLKPDGRLARRIATDLASLTDHAPLLSLHVGLPAWQAVEERNAS